MRARLYRWRLDLVLCLLVGGLVLAGLASTPAARWSGVALVVLGYGLVAINLAPPDRPGARRRRWPSDRRPL